MKNRVPYIGITDFETYSQIQKIIAVFAQLVGDKISRKLMVGLMMNYETLHGMGTDWANVWPTREHVGEMFRPHPLVLNTLHYADYKQRTTAEDLVNAIRFADSHNGLDALQLDMPWPDPEIIIGGVQDFIRNGRTLPVIMMIGSTASKECGYNMERIMQRIGNYRNIVDYILFDFSAGKGIPMEASLLGMHIRALVNMYGNEFAYVGAGGLGPGQMHLVRPLLGEFPDLSVDAQARLHIDDDRMKPSDPVRQENYLREMVPEFS